MNDDLINLMNQLLDIAEEAISKARTLLDDYEYFEEEEDSDE